MFLGSKTMTYSSRSVDSRSLLSEMLIKLFDIPCCNTGGEAPTKNKHNIVHFGTSGAPHHRGAAAGLVEVVY